MQWQIKMRNNHKKTKNHLGRDRLLLIRSLKKNQLKKDNRLKRKKRILKLQPRIDRN